MQVVSIMLVALATAPALAHALEFSGKRRLNQEQYKMVQPIYYPGFTVAGGIGEVGGLISVVVLLVLLPYATPAFWLTVVAIFGLLAMQIVFWVFTQPVNKFWLENTHLGKFGPTFFEISPASYRQGANADDRNWQRMRDRWEYSHIVRAGFATLSLFTLVVGTVVKQ